MTDAPIMKSRFAIAALFAACAAVPCACSSSADDALLQPGGGPQDASASDTDEPDMVADTGVDSSDGLLDAAAENASDAPEDSFDASGEGGDGGESDGGDQDVAQDAWDDGGEQDAAPDADAGPGIGESVCYFGDFDVNDVQEAACVAWPGEARTKLDLQGLTGGYLIDAVVRRADGQSIAVAGRLSANSPARLVIYPLSDSGAPVVVATAPSPDRTLARPAFSTDGQTLAFLADFDMAGAMGLYVVATSGGVPRRLSPAPTHPAFDVIDFAWSRGPGSRSWLAYVGDLDEDGVFALWTVDTASVPLAPVPVVPTSALSPDRDVVARIQWDMSDRVYFRTNQDDPQVWRVHSSDKAAADNRVLTDLMSADGPMSTYSFGLSRAGDRLAFSAGGPSPGALRLFVTQADALPPSPAEVSPTGVQPSSSVVGPAFGPPIRWSAGDTLLACASDWPVAASDVQDVFSAWALSPTQPSTAVRVLGAPQSVDSNVRELAFSRVGSRLFVRGDMVTDGAFELFSVDDLATANQDPVSCRIEEVPPGGDVLGLEWTP